MQPCRPAPVGMGGPRLLYCMCDWSQMLSSDVLDSSCQPVTYLRERVGNNSTSPAQSTGFSEELPWGSKKILQLLRCNTPCSLLGLSFGSPDLGKEVMSCVPGLLFFFRTRTGQLTCPTDPHISLTVFELLCVCADQIFHYSASAPACNRVDQIHLQIVLGSQHSHSLATVSK